MGTCSLYFHSSCAAGVDSRNRAEISFYARNHLPCSWHCWHFHRTKEKTHRNFLRHAASMSPEMKRMDMTGLNGSHMFSAGYICICQLIWTKFAKMGTERERSASDKTWNALQKGNLQANFANSMDFGKGETRSFGLFHGTFTAWCTLWQISFVGDVDSSRFLGQAWTSLDKRTAERLKVKRHGEGQLSAWSLTDVDRNSLLQFFSWGSHPHSKTLAEWEWHLLELSKMSISYHVMLWEMETEYNFHSHKQYLLVVLTFCVWRPHGKIFLSADFQCQSWSRCMEHRLS